MSGDKLVFDLANEVEDVPNVFVRKDWINILDNQNGNYNSNQSVIDTSQLSNSNKYMSYREGYLAVPLLLTLSNSTNNDATNANFLPLASASSADFAVGLKNWFGQIIHSLTLDFNGTTIIQQTPYINMWNSFKLMTSLSWQDVADLGPTMGFYPDDPLAFSFQVGGTIDNPDGVGVCNNCNMAPPLNVFQTPVGGYTDGNTGAYGTAPVAYNIASNYKSRMGNEGFLRRQSYINYDPITGGTDATRGGLCGASSLVSVASEMYSTGLLSQSSAQNLWKSHISRKTNGTNPTSGVLQISIMAFIHLRHIHSFFNQIPLIKGAFMKLTLNLNNCSTTFSVDGNGIYSVQSVSNSVGGVNPLMVASHRTTTVGGTITRGTVGGVDIVNGVSRMDYKNGGVPLGQGSYIASLSIGRNVLNSTQAGFITTTGTLSQSVVLYVPAYSFNAVFEQAYISSPIKKVIYEDIYQYQVLNVDDGSQINNLLTNGIANLRSCLILPFFSASVATHLAGAGIPVYQSPFDPAGTGPTSPLCLLSNFNIVVSGQNAIYNTERYSFEQFINQTYGCNSVNAGLTEGLSSSLINQLGWEMEYCYYYVDISRMLPVEQQVPKSVQVIGTNVSRRKLDLWCFLAYGCELSFDVVSGARV